jgi:hypothetical protein
MNDPELKAARRVTPEAREKWRRTFKEMKARPDVVKKVRAHLMGETNPFRNPEVNRRAVLALRERGYQHLTGGNGAEMPLPEKLLSQRLGWLPVVVPTGMAPTRGGIPTHYKIDIGDPILKIAIEADGASHQSKKVSAADRRKEAWLAAQGWRVLRFQNRMILEQTETVIAEIMKAVKSSTSRQGLGTISPTGS